MKLPMQIKRIATGNKALEEQFVANAASEKMASVLTLAHLQAEAKLGKRRNFERFLGAVADAPDEFENRK